MSKLTDIDHVGIAVHDLDATVAWYQQMFGATSCSASASGFGFSAPREKFESGIAKVFTIQPKPGGTNSPNGTRCDLS